MKPVELVERAVHNSSKRRDIVLDPFGGSDSTLIACEKTGRRARLIELDPRYVHVIVRRWQEWTGKQATRESDGVAFDDLAPRVSRKPCADSSNRSSASCAGLFCRRRLGIPGDLPKMLIGVFEVTGIATPESLLCFFHDDSAGTTGLLHHCVYFLPGRDIVTDG
jgi:hypothetical protein